MRSLALACLLVAATAHAQNADLTKEFQAGIDAFRLGKYDEARAHLEKARDVDPKLPGPYRFLAAVAQAQGKWDDCIANARKALELNPQSSETADTRKVHDECRLSAGRSAYRGDLADSAAVAVTTNVPGATVKINGLTYGATPLAPRPITAGQLDVEIEKQGWKSAKTTINGLPGIVTDVIVDLEPDPNATTAELHPETQEKLKIGWLVVPPTYGLSIDGKTTAPADRIELGVGTHVVELTAPDKDPWRRRVRIGAGQKTTLAPEFVDTATRSATEKRGLYLVGGGAFLLATGFVAAMISRSALDEARDIERIETAPGRAGAEGVAPIRTRAEMEDAADRATTYSRISNVAYGAGLVAAGVGAYYLYKGAKDRTDVPPPYAIAPTHGGVFVAKEIAW
ncbi:MAG TPA: PEGA domain-containing protein [Kofleriaceae bacterium]|nr:PEGA domain-containing protein [Kofleriaceae bacterium]